MRLTKREKLLASCLVVFTAAWLLFAFIVKPAYERVQTLSRVIPQKEDGLRKLYAESAEFISLSDELNNLREKMASQEGFQLLPFLESQIQILSLTDNVEAMKQNVLPLESNYSQTIVEVKLQNLTLAQLVDFLWQVESQNVLAAVKSLYIRKSAESKDLLDSTIEITNIKLLET
ncbi:MAG: hypothetical protein ACYSSO_11485 [Planctomycetota bacterium]